MNYQVVGRSEKGAAAHIQAKSNQYTFGIQSDQQDLAGPAELLLSAFAACCLKNVERFSTILNFSYVSAEIVVTGIRQEKPPMFVQINYTLRISSNDVELNTRLLQRNLEKYGTIYNTLAAVCKIEGQLSQQSV